VNQAARFVRTTFSAITLILGLAVTSTAHAITGSGVELGYGVEHTTAVRVGARWDWNTYWSVSDGWIASGFWEASLAYLHSDGPVNSGIWDAGITPVFRLRSGVSRFFLEGGIGAHYLTRDCLNNCRQLGSKLLFGDLLGFGWNFGEKDRYELGYRFLHHSNAYLAEPNDGVNLHLIRLGFNY